MSPKTIIILFMSAGSFIGSLLPEAIGPGAFSAGSLIGGIVGAAVGLYIGYRVTNTMQ